MATWIWDGRDTGQKLGHTCTNQTLWDRDTIPCACSSLWFQTRAPPADAAVEGSRRCIVVTSAGCSELEGRRALLWTGDCRLALDSSAKYIVYHNGSPGTSSSDDSHRPLIAVNTTMLSKNVFRPDLNSILLSTPGLVFPFNFKVRMQQKHSYHIHAQAHN